MSRKRSLTRRSFLGALAAAGAGAVLRPTDGASQTGALITRAIPSSKEALPVVGLGSWITFNVGDDAVAARVLRRSHARLLRSGRADDRFLADVRIVAGRDRLRPRQARQSAGALLRRQGVDSSGDAGRRRSRSLARLWGIPRFDLLQVHNLLAWEEHLETLFAMKADRQAPLCRHHDLGGAAPPEIEEIMRSQPIDFVQVDLQCRSTARSRRASCRLPPNAASP